MLINLLDLAYPSFKIKFLRQYFTISFIIKGFLAAVLLSAFIYLQHFEIYNVKFLNTFFALLGFYLLLKHDKKVLFWSGFFIGIFWFYWIGFSFRYYDMTYLIPLMMFFTALIYGLIFWVAGIFNNPLPRAVLFLFLSYFQPINFNWFIPELTLLNTYFGIEKWQFGLFLLSIALFIILKNKMKYIAIAILILAVEFQPKKSLILPNQKVYLSQTTLSQDIKWNKNYLHEIVQNNFHTIHEAIRNDYDIVVLSESMFPLFLNQETKLIEQLKELSHKIAIITGGLYYKAEEYYNSTYYFVNGKMHLAHKVVLVPFGEEIPLPKFISKYINQLFFNGAEDYNTAKEPTDIEINGETFRNAICYEATRDELYKDNPKYIIATSNNAWFTPSIEPTLQNLLLKYFSKRYGTVIFHTANMGKNDIIY